MNYTLSVVLATLAVTAVVIAVLFVVWISLNEYREDRKWRIIREWEQLSPEQRAKLKQERRKWELFREHVG